MPYICLARGDVPDGILQVLDLQPNSSQRIPAKDAEGETRYVNRALTASTTLNSLGTLQVSHLDGLAAYLIDNVEIGGTEQAAGSITVLALQASTETVTINGVVFTAVDFGTEVAANQTFASVASAGGSIAATAATLTATINNAASVALMKLGTITGQYAFATNASPAVTLVARHGAGVATTGWAGSLALAKSGGSHFTLSGARMTRTHEIWTKAYQAAFCAAVLARVDAGQSLTLSDINGGLSTYGADLSGTTGTSGSHGTVAGFLQVLSGRTYRIKQTTLAGVAVQYMDATYPTFKFGVTAHGGFTEQVLVGGDMMSHGEIKASTIGGTVVNREVGGIRYTSQDSAAFSLLGGQLDVLTGPVTMWPTSSVVPQFPYNLSGFTVYDTVAASRLVTVYDDDGTILA